jgi:putative ABC transport system ATP-binding protein
MITLENVQRWYGSGANRMCALRGISMQVERGEFVTFIGTSGSGKTTLLNVIGGLDRQFEGSVQIDGKALESLTDRDISAMRSAEFGFVFQQFNLLDHLTCLENVTLPAFFGPPIQNPHARGVELLERVGLADRRDALPSQLSGGQKQRVAIARSLFYRPRIVLCDEPTGSLDRQTGLEILDLFASLRSEENVTLLMVTHEEYIAKLSHRIVRLEDGKLLADQENRPERPSESLLLAGNPQ